MEEAPTTMGHEPGSGGDNGPRRTVQLRSVVVDNFKNYVGQHTIEVGNERFVCFFGRNGTGKSCVVDAIAFCLGASPQQLRVKRFASLVNDLVGGRSPAATASVALCLEEEERGEMTTRKKSFWIKRTVDATTSQTKFYYSDQMKPSWKMTSRNALEATLSHHGIDMQLQDRYIIRQSNASGLAQLSSQQLLHFCERVIGTSYLKDELVDLETRWDQLYAETEKTKGQIAALYKESERCQPMVLKFQEWVARKEQLQANRSKVEKDISYTLHALLGKYKCDLIQAQTALDKSKEEYAALSKAAEAKSKAETICSRAINDQQKRVLEAKTSVTQLTKQKATTDSRLTVVEEDLLSLHERHKRLEKDRDMALSDIERLQDCVDKDTSENTDLVKQMQDIEKAFSELPDESPRTEDHLLSVVTQIEQVEQSLRALETTKNAEAHKRNALNNAVEQAQEILTTAVVEKEACESNLSQLKIALKSNMTALEELKSTKATLKKDIEQLDRSYARMERAQFEQTARFKGDGAIHHMKTLLGRKVIFGRMWQLASTESKFTNAVNAAMHPYLDHLVVQTRSAAISVAKAFVDGSIGRVTCCIVDEIEDCCSCTEDAGGSKVDESIPLCQVIICLDRTVRRAFHKYSQNWLICPNIDDAIVTSKKLQRNCVTLQGDIFYADGAIRTWCSERRQGSRPKIRAKAEITSAPATNAMTGNLFQIHLYETRNQLRENQAKYTLIMGQIDELTSIIASQEREIRLYTSRLDELVRNVSRFESRRNVAQSQLLLSASRATDDFDACTKEYTEKLIDLKKNRTSLAKSSVSRKRQQLYSKRARTQSNLSACQTRIRSTQDLLAKAQKTVDSMTKQQESISNAIAKIEKEKEETSRLVKSICVDIEKATRKLNELQAALSSRKNELHQLREDRSRIEDELRSIDAWVGRDIKKTRQIESQIANVEDEIRGFNTPILEHLSFDMSVSTVKLEQDKRQLTDSLRYLSEESRVLEAVKSSISAEDVERAVACEHELSNLNDVVEQNSKALAQLRSQQNEVSTTRYNQLALTLRLVNGNFVRIYRLLNEDGDCYLGYSHERQTLFNEGITLNCKPDDSHWQSFIGLSGGQQVVCAVSLMLALQVSFSSPFYVCDEIDAALDTLNVKKLAQLLQEQSRETATQFFVVSHRPEMWDAANFMVARDAASSNQDPFVETAASSGSPTGLFATVRIRVVCMHPIRERPAQRLRREKDSGTINFTFGNEDKTTMDLNPVNPFGDLMSKAVKLKGHQQAQLRTSFDSWPQYFQHSMFMQESVISVRTKPFDERIEAAESMKATGNDHYAHNDLEEAVAEYEKALSVFKYAENMDPGWKKKGIEDKDIRVVDYKCDNPNDQARLDALKTSCYQNIAVCKFKLKEFQTCIRACDDTLELVPNNTKALYRRALALITPASSGALEFDQALANLQTAYNIDPGNKEVRKMYRELREQKVRQQKLDRETFTGMFKRGQIYDGSETRKEEAVADIDDEEARDRKFQQEVEEAETLARMCEAKGETKYAQEIREKVETAKQARNRRRKEVDFFNPTEEMIEDAKKQGIDLTDPQVQAMLHQLQEDEKQKQKDPTYQPPDRSDPAHVEADSVDSVLKSMTNEQIANMLRREGIDYHNITDREQFLETARQVLASKLSSSSNTPKKSYFWTIVTFAIAWTMLRLYTTGGLAIMWRVAKNAFMGKGDTIEHSSLEDGADFFDD